MATPTLSIQYLAGLFDGEGCISCDARTVAGRHWSTACRTRFRVCLVNTHKGVLDMIAVAYGGKVDLKRKSTAVHKICWTWEPPPLIATRFIGDVLPHLVIKKKQAEAYLMARDTFRNTRISSPGVGGQRIDPMAIRIRAICARSIKQLNAARWAA